MSLFLLTLLAACEEAAAPSDEVSWSGWVYVDQDDEHVLTEGAAEFWPEGAEEPVAAEQPYIDDYPGYWEVFLSPGVPANVHLTGAAERGTWWAGDAPTARGNWFGGALFAVTDAWLRDVFDALGEDEDAWLAASAEGVVVLGYPADSELGCAQLTVGAEVPLCWSVDEAGVIAPAAADTAVTWFLALAEPGEVVVGMAGAEERWTAEAGEVILPWYLSGGGS